jgi:hypothetical protein
MMTTAGSGITVKSAGVLLNDVTTVASPTTFNIDVTDPPTGHSQLFVVGDVLRMKWGGADNWCTVDSVSDQTTFWRYACILDSGSTTTFYAGTAVVDYGQSGDGGVLTTADSANSPYVTVFTHAGSPWSATTQKVRIGNLNGYGSYASDLYGMALGDATNQWLSVDDTNGLRIMDNTTVKFQVDGSGNMDLTGVMSIGTSGGIYQGTGTFAAPTTGLKIWNDTGVGRIAGYSAGVIQWYANTDGKLYAGGGDVLLDAGGLKLVSSASPSTTSYIQWYGDGELSHYIQAINDPVNDDNMFTFYAGNVGYGRINRIRLHAWGAGTADTWFDVSAITGGTGAIEARIDGVDVLEHTVLRWILYSGVMEVREDTDTKHIFGRAWVGWVGHADYNDFAGFGHIDFASSGNFALIQGNAGQTVINAATGQSVFCRINNSTIMSVAAAGVTVSAGGLTVSTGGILISGGGLSVTDGVVSARPDTDTEHILGRAKIGYNGATADSATFAHFDRMNTTDFALRQNSGGNTYLNSNLTMYFQNAGGTEMNLTGSGLQLTTGARANEFSTDSAMVGNSNTAVPTEQAVQEYAAGYKGWDQGASFSTSTTGSYQVVTGSVVTANIYNGEALVFVAVTGSYSVGAVIPSFWIGIRIDGGATTGVGQTYLNHSGLDYIANIAGMIRYSGLSSGSHTWQTMVYLNVAGTWTTENTGYRGAYLAVFEVK